MSNTIETALEQGRDALDVIAAIYRKAGELVTRVNPGADVTGPEFAAKRTEVAEALTRRLTTSASAAPSAGASSRSTATTSRSASLPCLSRCCCLSSSLKSFPQWTS